MSFIPISRFLLYGVSVTAGRTMVERGVYMFFFFMIVFYILSELFSLGAIVE
jgi:hypothetical protein